jgi:hypothetical protein
MIFIIKIFSHKLRGAPWPVAEIYCIFIFYQSGAGSREFNEGTRRKGAGKERKEIGNGEIRATALTSVGLYVRLRVLKFKFNMIVVFS